MEAGTVQVAIATEIADIDQKLSDKTVKATIIAKARLIRRRRELYNQINGTRPRFFIPTTAGRTGISSDVLRRLEEIGGLPDEVLDSVQGTRVEKSQKLLLQLAVAVYGRPLPEQLHLAKEMTIPTVAAKTQEEPELLATLDVEVINFCGFPICVRWDDGQPRIRDIDLAFALELKQLRGIRKIIRNNLHLLPTHRVRARQAQTPMPTGGAREDQVDEYWLTLADALFVTTQCRTGVAKTITLRVVKGFLDAQKYVDSQPNPLATTVMDDIEGRLQRLEAAVISGGYAWESATLIQRRDGDARGWSMEGINEMLIASGRSIGKHDTAVRSFASTYGLKIIGDHDYGYWNPVGDAANGQFSYNWRFNDRGLAVILKHMVRFLDLKRANEEASIKAPREKALEDAMSDVRPIGVGKYDMLTRSTRDSQVPAEVSALLAHAEQPTEEPAQNAPAASN